MSKSSNAELENAFLRVLQEADPGPSGDSLVEEFASHLTALTEAWATDSQKLHEHERWLDNWVKRNTQERGAVEALSSNEPAEAVSYSTEREVCYSSEEESEAGEVS